MQIPGMARRLELFLSAHTVVIGQDLLLSSDQCLHDFVCAFADVQVHVGGPGTTQRACARLAKNAARISGKLPAS
eukprot:8129911-Alexandrium_andersonii.AAC.1